MNITLQHKQKATELAYAAGKGLIASIPFVGGIAAELIGVTIPNKRMERVEQMLTHFSEKVKDIEKSVLHQSMQEDDFVELFEEGVSIAAKASARAKLQAVANILADGVNPEAEITTLKKILSTYGRLEDLELVFLVAMKKKHDTFWQYARNNPESNRLVSELNYSFPELIKIAIEWRTNAEMPEYSDRLPDAYADHSIQRLVNEKLIVVTEPYREHFLSPFGHKLLLYLSE